jgi:hypothetical protein
MSSPVLPAYVLLCLVLLACELLRLALLAAMCAIAVQTVLVPAVTRALTGSGLYQVLLEGALLLLGLDPAAYSQALDTQVEVSGILKTAVQAAIFLGGRPLGIP